MHYFSKSSIMLGKFDLQLLVMQESPDNFNCKIIFK